MCLLDQLASLLLEFAGERDINTRARPGEIDDAVIALIPLLTKEQSLFVSA